MSPEFGGHHFFGPEDQIFYVDQESYLKFAHMNLERSFFSTFVIFIFHGPTLGHVFGHVATCHVGVMHIKLKLLEH